MQLKFDAQGLIPVVVQSRDTGEVRMVAFANREAVEKTLTTGKAHFYSRSRQSQWMKGESSGNTIEVHEIWTDCDQDTLIYLATANGPTCHTGEESCFYQRVRSLERDESEASDSDHSNASPTLHRLAQRIHQRASDTAAKSYTRYLLDKGASKLREKLLEEAGELSDALANESKERVASEFADLLYHAVVSLELRGISLRKPLAMLHNRFAQSGHAEKASRA